jgi:hypothetical protein
MTHAIADERFRVRLLRYLDVLASVADDRGGLARQPFTLTVAPDTIDPRVVVSASPAPATTPVQEPPGAAVMPAPA